MYDASNNKAIMGKKKKKRRRNGFQAVTAYNKFRLYNYYR